MPQQPRDRKKPTLYGLDRLGAGPVLLVEGESDCWAAWAHGLNAIGVQGANNWKAEFAEALAGREVYVWKEPDKGGQTFVANMVADLESAKVITPPAGASRIYRICTWRTPMGSWQRSKVSWPTRGRQGRSSCRYRTPGVPEPSRKSPGQDRLDRGQDLASPREGMDRGPGEVVEVVARPRPPPLHRDGNPVPGSVRGEGPGAGGLRHGGEPGVAPIPSDGSRSPEP